MKSQSLKKEWIGLIIGFIGIMAGCFVVRLFNQYVLMLIPLIPRMITMIISYWIIAIAPLILFFVHNDKLEDCGFSKENLFFQILIGIGLGIGMSFILTLIPHLFGFSGFVDNGNRYKFVWQFIFEFTYCIAAVGAVEEFGFRGFIYARLKKITNGKEFVPIIVSSVLFGLFHVFGGNVFQIFMTALIGTLFCFLRLKIKNCSTLSLIICHGVYDAMITLWASLFLA